MKYRARCNKRECQARRNLNKPIEQYLNRPKCHIIGCNGLMYLDKYRQSKKDKTKNCIDPFCQFFENTGCPTPVHRVGSRGCSHYKGEESGN